VLEDDLALCSEIGSLVRGWGVEAFEAHSIGEATEQLEQRRPELVIADLWLHGESAIPLIDTAVHRQPAPAVVAMSGQASPEETFRLGRLNVRSYLQKPFSGDQLAASVERALADAPDVVPWHRGLVGHESLKGAQKNLRDVMLYEAIARQGGSRSGAARILRVSRQAIQQVLQRAPRSRRKPSEPGDGASRD
jgi:two-component system response regulator RegA